MYKKRIWLILMILSISLSGCKMIGNKDSNPNKAREKLMNMKGYSCLARITHKDDSTINTYEAKKVYLMDKRYRLEVVKPDHIAGLTTIYNGEKVIQYNPQMKPLKRVELPNNNFRNQIFLGSFVENYLQSEDVAIEVQMMEEGLTTVLEAVIPGGSKYMSTQKLWIDKKTQEPVQMVIYNEDDQDTVTIEFLEFTYNPDINESIFMIN